MARKGGCAKAPSPGPVFSLAFDFYLDFAAIFCCFFLVRCAYNGWQVQECAAFSRGWRIYLVASQTSFTLGNHWQGPEIVTADAPGNSCSSKFGMANPVSDHRLALSLVSVTCGSLNCSQSFCRYL